MKINKLNNLPSEGGHLYQHIMSFSSDSYTWGRTSIQITIVNQNDSATLDDFINYLYNNNFFIKGSFPNTNPILYPVTGTLHYDGSQSENYDTTILGCCAYQYTSSQTNHLHIFYRKIDSTTINMFEIGPSYFKDTTNSQGKIKTIQLL